MDKPFVSVIIPAYNGEAYLAEAVESTQRQNYHPLEIIIVDDGSTDGTAQIATSFKGEVRYMYQPNSGGPAAGRNRGLKMARGEVIAFLDQDALACQQIGAPSPSPGRGSVIGGCLGTRTNYEAISICRW